MARAQGGPGAVGHSAAATGDYRDVLPDGHARALAAWMALAVVIGVLAPAGVLARWGRDRAVRRALLPTLAVLGVQVAGETASARRLPPWTAAVSGTLCTAVRLWQLRAAAASLAAATGGVRPPRDRARGRAAATAVVRIGSLFWIANLPVFAATTPGLVRASRNRR